jgi:hypothetical protein
LGSSPDVDPRGSKAELMSLQVQKAAKAAREKQKAVRLNPFLAAAAPPKKPKKKHALVGDKVTKPTQLGSFSSVRMHVQGVPAKAIGPDANELEDDNPIPMAFRKVKKRTDVEFDPFQDGSSEEKGDRDSADGAMEGEDTADGSDEAGASEGSKDAGGKSAGGGASAAEGEAAKKDNGLVKVVSASSVKGEIPDDMMEEIERRRENDEMADILTEDGFEDEVRGDLSHIMHVETFLISYRGFNWSFGCFRL